VSIPIGRARDITLNGLDVLASADVIVAEDTRMIKKLLNIYSIPLSGLKLISYHDHNAKKQIPKILDFLELGSRVAFVSDAGTPLISDPGYLLVKEIAKKGFLVTSAPGPSAVLAALTVSGLPTDKFMFCGFLPNQKTARSKYIMSCNIPATTLIFFETSNRIIACLDDMISQFGTEREIVVCRELTKKFETIYRGSVIQVREQLNKDTIKGEIVLLISPGIAEKSNIDEIERSLIKLMDSHSLKESVQIVATNFNVSKKTIYQMALKLKEN
jgi:16S rRNA (cytidine1402-2'-O)-methyltransferase